MFGCESWIEKITDLFLFSVFFWRFFRPQRPFHLRCPWLRFVSGCLLLNLQAWIRRRPSAADSFFFVTLFAFVYTNNQCSPISFFRTIDTLIFLTVFIRHQNNGLWKYFPAVIFNILLQFFNVVLFFVGCKTMDAWNLLPFVNICPWNLPWFFWHLLYYILNYMN